MRAGVIRGRPEEEAFSAERCHILELSNSPADPEVSVARARVEAGITTARHRLRGIDERYVILEGRGLMEVGEMPPVEVGPGDVVLVPAGASQRITNRGDGDLLFLCVCTPPYRPQAYEDLER